MTTAPRDNSSPSPSVSLELDDYPQYSVTLERVIDIMRGIRAGRCPGEEAYGPFTPERVAYRTFVFASLRRVLLDLAEGEYPGFAIDAEREYVERELDQNPNMETEFPALHAEYCFLEGLLSVLR